ncbi:MAG: LuxR C-terminal-related transcriptional regulator [Actinomycetota bacterium]|nr:LuxR C-terminal-related transcriptional regulator [Actinomycetota bacterium]
MLAPHLEAAYRRARSAGLLTSREREVLSLVRQGLTNREIAHRLGITSGTVRSHLEHAFAKLGVGTRTAAVAVS